jgi:hypothetical protein
MSPCHLSHQVSQHCTAVSPPALQHCQTGAAGFAITSSTQAKQSVSVFWVQARGQCRVWWLLGWQHWDRKRSHTSAVATAVCTATADSAFVCSQNQWLADVMQSCYCKTSLNNCRFMPLQRRALHLLAHQYAACAQDSTIMAEHAPISACLMPRNLVTSHDAHDCCSYQCMLWHQEALARAQCRTAQAVHSH